MKVIYYTFTPFLDCALELINVLKKQVELHVIIEISPETKTSNIIDVEKLPEGELFVKPVNLLDEQSYNMVQPYLEGTASAHFLVYTHKRSFSATTFWQSLKAGKFIKRLKPDVIHFEGYSTRSLGMISFIRSVGKVFYTVHDPQPHSGEYNWRLSLSKRLFGRLASGYFFYSKFALKQFEQYHMVHVPRYVMHLYPYHFYRNFISSEIPSEKYVLFFGRISAYKGIDVLLKAMPAFLKDMPEGKLVIAGKSVNGYHMDRAILETYKEQITVLDKYLSNEELVALISNAAVVVCPYRDATQSGVLMTAYALNTPVIATEVWAFPEYIRHNVNGMLFSVNDSQALARKLVEAFKGDFYTDLEKNIRALHEHEKWSDNLPVLMAAYSGGDLHDVPENRYNQLEKEKGHA